MFELENHCYSVSEVTASIKMLLESRFPSIHMEGEISNFRPSGAGHCYFTLKDNHSMIQAVLFRGDASKLSFRPQDGMKVKAVGRITVYPQRGNYQIICSSLEKQGKGSILEMLEERKSRLSAEGLFDEQYKKAIPSYPRSITVITSSTGAAIRDILNVLKRRNSSINVRILPTSVQGQEAAGQIVSMIQLANRNNWGELIILSRGGGSLEDLLPFSEESVVRAVSSSYIPIMTGIGHEIDFSLSDFAADLRAPTPSAAAELVCRSSMEIQENLSSIQREMEISITNRLKITKEKMRLFRPEEINLHFQRYVEPLKLRIDDLRDSVSRGMINTIESKKHEFALAKQTMENLSPFAILDRGYSLVSDSNGKVVKSIEQINVEDEVNIRFANGRAKAKIEEKNERTEI